MTTFEFNRDEMRDIISRLYGRYPMDDDIVKLYDIIMGSCVQIDAAEVLFVDERSIYIE